MLSRAARSLRASLTSRQADVGRARPWWPGVRFGGGVDAAQSPGLGLGPQRGGHYYSTNTSRRPTLKPQPGRATRSGPRRSTGRLLGLGAGVAGLGLATAFGLKAFEENIVFYMTPTQVLEAYEGLPPDGDQRRLRMGGLVVSGSVVYSSLPTGKRQVAFDVTDLASEVPVRYTGILPDLFKEGQSVVVEGTYSPAAGCFSAAEVLAKHDEAYMPPEIAEKVQKNRDDLAKTNHTTANGMHSPHTLPATKAK